ncbi:hypothetical protein ACF0H5_001523 [Mactra antiquata]
MRFEECHCVILFVLSVYTVTVHCRNVLVLIADDAGFETKVYNNTVCKTPNINNLAEKSVIFKNAFTSVSSCSPSRSVILSGLPQHQNGMYGLHQGYHHFMSFDEVRSLPKILKKHDIRTGIIGKKHVGPESVYPFDYDKTEPKHDILQVGRNITNIKLLVRTFLQQQQYDTRPFFLYIGFHDPHRCEHTHPEYGSFCEKFDNGEPGMGTIPDWKPIQYNPDEVDVPYFIQNTSTSRLEISKQYTTISRLDQGIGLVLNELKTYGYDKDTLILYSSDNGIPFINGRTNLYDSGMAEPFLVSSPYHTARHGQVSDVLVSHVDIVPTVLHWFGISYPKYTINGIPVQPTGKSLLPVLKSEVYEENQPVFASHNLHEVTMYYPMRVVRTKQYKLIHNLNYRMPFTIDQDFFISDSFQDLLNRTRSGTKTYWFKALKDYYYREPWELYNINVDPHETKNLINDSSLNSVIKYLKQELVTWQNITGDPWICSPSGILEDKGRYKTNPQCFSADYYLDL